MRARTQARKRSSFAHWTAEEDAIIRREWGEISARVLCQKLPGRTWAAVKNRACKELGLSTGIPQGYVTIKEAARRCGYSDDTLVRLLGRHAVIVRSHPFPCTRKPRKSARPWRIVEWDAVVEAVKADQTTEVVTAAARSRGLVDVTLRAWLLEEGVVARGRRGSGQRVSTEVIDRVVAKHTTDVQGKERLVDAARRHRIVHTTLSRWLIRAEVYPRGRHQTVWLDPRVVDQVVSNHRKEPVHVHREHRAPVLSPDRELPPRHGRAAPHAEDAGRRGRAVRADAPGRLTSATAQKGGARG